MFCIGDIIEAAQRLETEGFKPYGILVSAFTLKRITENPLGNIPLEQGDCTVPMMAGLPILTLEGVSGFLVVDKIAFERLAVLTKRITVL